MRCLTLIGSLYIDKGIFFKYHKTFGEITRYQFAPARQDEFYSILLEIKIKRDNIHQHFVNVKT